MVALVPRQSRPATGPAEDRMTRFDMKLRVDDIDSEVLP